MSLFIENVLSYLHLNKINEFVSIKNRYIHTLIKEQIYNFRIIDNLRFNEVSISLPNKNKDKIIGAFIYHEIYIIVILEKEILIYCQKHMNSGNKDDNNEDNFVNTFKINIKFSKNSFKLSENILLISNGDGSDKNSLFNISKSGEISLILDFNKNNNNELTQCILKDKSELNYYKNDKIKEKTEFLIILGFISGYINIYDLNINECLIELKAEIHIPNIIQISCFEIHNDKYLLVGGGDGSIKIFEDDFTIESNYFFNKEHLLSIMLLYSYNNNIVTFSRERLLKFWRINKSESIMTINCFLNIPINYYFNYRYGVMISGDITNNIVFNNFYSKNFEIVKKIKIKHVPNLLSFSKDLRLMCYGSIGNNNINILYIPF